MNSMTNLIDVGMSGEGMADTYKEIYDNMYNPVVEEITKNTNSMIDSVESYWVGSSADKFKRYIKKELENALKNLESVNENIRSNMVNVSADMQALDSLTAAMITTGNFVGDYSANVSKPYSTSIQPTSIVSTIQSNEEIQAIADKITVDNDDDDELHGKSLRLKDQEGFLKKVNYLGNRANAMMVAAHLMPLEGLGIFGESLFDGTVIIATGTIATPVTGIIDLIGYNYNIIVDKKDADEYNSITGKMWKGVQGYVKEENCKGMFNDLYNNTAFGQWAKKYTYSFDLTRSIGNKIGESVPMVLLTIATGGGAGLVSYIPMATTAVTSMGKNTGKAWKEDASIVGGLVYGATTAAVDAVITKFGFGNISKMSSAASGAVAKVTTNSFVPKVAASVVSVAANASISASKAFIEPAEQMIYRSYYKDENDRKHKFENAGLKEKYEKLFKEAGGFKNVGKVAFTSGIMAAIAEGTKLADFARKQDIERKTGSYTKQLYNKDSEVIVSEGTKNRVYNNIISDKSKTTNSIMDKFKTGVNNKYVKKIIEKLLDDDIKVDNVNAIIYKGSIAGMPSYVPTSNDIAA